MARTADGGAKSDGAVTLESLTAIVAGLAEAVERLAARPTTPGTLPRAKTTAELLKGMRRGEERAGQTRIDPFGQSPAYHPDDVVRLIHEEKLKQLQRSGKVGDSDELYGVVKAFMYRRRRDGKRKYRVDFGKGIGEDGLMEDEIELA